MAMLSNTAMRASGAGLQRALLAPVTLIGFLSSISLRDWLLAVGGALLLWYGVSNAVNWTGPTAAPPAPPPGHYIPPAVPAPSPAQTSAPQTSRQPAVQPVLPKMLTPPAPPFIVAQPIPELDGVEAPPRAPPPPPEPAFGVMRGHRPVVTPKYITD